MEFDDGDIDDDLDPAMKEELDRLDGHAEHLLRWWIQYFTENKLWCQAVILKDYLLIWFSWSVCN